MQRCLVVYTPHGLGSIVHLKSGAIQSEKLGLRSLSSLYSYSYSLVLFRPGVWLTLRLFLNPGSSVWADFRFRSKIIDVERSADQLHERQRIKESILICRGKAAELTTLTTTDRGEHLHR